MTHDEGKKEFEEGYQMLLISHEMQQVVQGAASGSQQNPAAEGVSSLQTKHQENSCSSRSWSGTGGPGVTFWHSREHGLC